MTLNELKVKAGRNDVINPEVIRESVNRLDKGKLTDVIPDEKVVYDLALELADKNATFGYLSNDTQSGLLAGIISTSTLDEVIEYVAEICGGNILRPYIKYLNCAQSKFECFEWPEDVIRTSASADNMFSLKQHGYTEPEYFTEYEEEEIVFAQSCDYPNRLDFDYLPAYFEAPAAPLLTSGEPLPEPLYEALKSYATFKLLANLLPSLILTVM